jgi:adenylosuccinate synthase
MPVTVVVGGQFGSEGKGKVAHYLAKEMDASVAIRCGGPNSGHTVIDPKGRPIIFQQLPTPSILPDISIVLCAGSYIDFGILMKEIRIAGLNSERLLIDPNAVVITQEIRLTERNSGLTDLIGSTGSGTGEAILRRIQRKPNVTFAKDIPDFLPYLGDTRSFLRNRLSSNERIILEGTQGFGLSLLHSPFYPYVTSRDTTAGSFLSESGLSPLDVDDVVLTIRTFPIRVSGNSGPLFKETQWDAVTKQSGSSSPILEYTSVSKKLRRVGKFDPDIVRHAIIANNPTRIILNHLDYIDVGCAVIAGNTRKTLTFIELVEESIGREVDFIGFGPGVLKTHTKDSVKLRLA